VGILLPLCRNGINCKVQLPCPIDLARTSRAAVAEDFLFDDPERSALALVWSPRGDRIAFAVGQFFPMVPGKEHIRSQLALIGPMRASSIGRWRPRGLPQFVAGRQAIGVPVRRRTNARLANHRNSRRIESQA
jgi:hypothetical protein